MTPIARMRPVRSSSVTSSAAVVAAEHLPVETAFDTSTNGSSAYASR